MNDKSDPDGSVTGSPPDTDDGRLSVAAHDQDASGRETGKPKPINSVGRSHPGAKVASKDVTSRDQQWVDIGSGIVSRTFIGAEKLMTTSRGGPNIIDIQHRKVWSLTSRKLLHECDVNDVTDEELNKQLPAPDNIRVELTLRNALKLFERRGPDVAEIFSQPRVCQEVGGRRFQGEELRPGWSLDLTMNDPKTGKPWDLSQASVQSRVRKLVRSTKPYCLIGSPPCTPFSPLQEISRAKRDPKIMAEELRQGQAHINFCLQLYAMQIAGKRHFIHEHPAGSKAWETNELKQFMMRPEVDSTILHMCAYGMTSVDEIGEGLVKKPTRIMSSAPEVLKRVGARCSNENGGPQHRHVHLVQGRAKAAQVYPRELSLRICEGIAAQRKIDRLGIEVRPLMTVDDMRKATKGANADACPS